jgi:hypothetical protein
MFYSENLPFTVFFYCLFEFYQKFMKFVWLDLDSICKICERNRKQKIRKEEEKEKYKLGLREPLGPDQRSSPQPRKDTETVSLIFFFSLTSLMCGATRQATSASSSSSRHQRSGYLRCQ